MRWNITLLLLLVSYVVLQQLANLQICIVALNTPAHRKSPEQNLSADMGQIQVQPYMRVHLICLGKLDLTCSVLPYKAGSLFQCGCFVAGIWSLHKHSKQNLCFYIQQCNALKLGDNICSFGSRMATAASHSVVSTSFSPVSTVLSRLKRHFLWSLEYHWAWGRAWPCSFFWAFQDLRSERKAKLKLHELLTFQ